MNDFLESQKSESVSIKDKRFAELGLRFFKSWKDTFLVLQMVWKDLLKDDNDKGKRLKGGQGL